MLRIIAFATMFIDHLGIVFFPQYLIFRIIGRLALPIFAYNIAQGYRYTRNVFLYGQRILLLAFISQIPHFLIFQQDILNICFTLFLGLVAIYFYDKINHPVLKIALILALLLFSNWANLEYGAYAVLMILLFFITQDSLIMLIVLSTFIIFYNFIDISNFLNIFAFPAIFLIFFLRKYNFKIKRVWNYLFYPLHLTLLYLISLFIF